VRTSNPALPFVTSAGHTLPGVTSGYWVDELYGAGPCVASDCWPTSGAPVVVTGVNTTSGIAVSLKAGARITGDTHSGFSPNIDVYDSRGVLLPNRVAYTSFIAPNLYFAAGLPAGTYYLLRHREMFAASTEQLYSGIACDGCAVTFGTPIVVS